MYLLLQVVYLVLVLLLWPCSEPCSLLLSPFWLCFLFVKILAVVGFELDVTKAESLSTIVAFSEVHLVSLVARFFVAFVLLADDGVEEFHIVNNWSCFFWLFLLLWCFYLYRPLFLFLLLNLPILRPLQPPKSLPSRLLRLHPINLLLRLLIYFILLSQLLLPLNLLQHPELLQVFVLEHLHIFYLGVSQEDE